MRVTMVFLIVACFVANVLASSAQSGFGRKRGRSTLRWSHSKPRRVPKLHRLVSDRSQRAGRCRLDDIFPGKKDIQLIFVTVVGGKLAEKDRWVSGPPEIRRNPATTRAVWHSGSFMPSATSVPRVARSDQRKSAARNSRLIAS